jgi:hypothetical protein
MYLENAPAYYETATVMAVESFMEPFQSNLIYAVNRALV